MARSKKEKPKKNSNGANLGFEEKYWQMADALRNDNSWKYGVPPADSLNCA